MKKKADVNWVVISMVIAIIALAITAYIFWDKSTSASDQASGIAQCIARGGDCKTTCDPGEISLGKFSCNEGEQCCVPINDEFDNNQPAQP